MKAITDDYKRKLHWSAYGHRRDATPSATQKAVEKCSRGEAMRQIEHRHKSTELPTTHALRAFHDNRFHLVWLRVRPAQAVEVRQPRAEGGR